MAKRPVAINELHLLAHPYFLWHPKHPYGNKRKIEFGGKPYDAKAATRVWKEEIDKLVNRQDAIFVLVAQSGTLQYIRDRHDDVKAERDSRELRDGYRGGYSLSNFEPEVEGAKEHLMRYAKAKLGRRAFVIRMPSEARQPYALSKLMKARGFEPSESVRIFSFGERQSMCVGQAADEIDHAIGKMSKIKIEPAKSGDFAAAPSLGQRVRTWLAKFSKPN